MFSGTISLRFFPREFLHRRATVYFVINRYQECAESSVFRRGMI
jgi:hypothetical protein